MSNINPITENSNSINRPFFALIPKFINQKLLIISIIILERLAWWVLILQFPIYLSQKGVVGGLEWSQTNKGYLYAMWAIFQNLTPIFFAFVIDKLGQKKSLLIFLSLILFSYLVLSISNDIYLIWFSIFIFSIGSGLFRITTLKSFSEINIFGKFTHNTTSKNTSLNWAFYIFIINLSIFFVGTPLAFYLKNLGWQFVFIGCVLLILVNIILSLNLINNKIDKEKVNEEKIDKNIEVINQNNKVSFAGVINVFGDKKFIIPILLMSSFNIIYLLFYEYLPNYIYDWIDTTDLINYLGISNVYQITTNLGSQISYEWFYNINTGVIILLIFPSILLFNKFNLKILPSLILGLFLVVVGIGLSFLFNKGMYLFFGIIIYSIGEMLCNTFLLDWADKNKKAGQEAQYFGFLNLSSTIGYVFASIFGAYYFESIAEKSSIISQIKGKSNLILNNINSDINFNINLETTNKLWIELSPFQFIYPFIILGIVSLISLFIFHLITKKMDK